jgi:pimeloyl-ACP methyl ester carboxylesterase
MRRVVQSPETFVDSDAHEPIIVHGASETMPGQLILFVHGLNGHRYRTWGRFPLLFRDHTHYDIGLYGYTSGYGRISKLSAKFDMQAEELAHQLRDCAYPQIVLIGHSMGGLLCMAAIETYLTEGPLQPLSGSLVSS